MSSSISSVSGAFDALHPAFASFSKILGEASLPPKKGGGVQISPDSALLIRAEGISKKSVTPEIVAELQGQIPAQQFGLKSPQNNAAVHEQVLQVVSRLRQQAATNSAEHRIHNTVIAPSAALNEYRLQTSAGLTHLPGAQINDFV